MPDPKTIVRRLLEEPSKGDFDVIDHYVAPDYVGHVAAEPGPIRGIEGFKTFVQRYLEGFTGAETRVDEQIAEGDKVATLWTARRTHTGEISGIEPTGKDITVTGITISRVENGKLVEDRATWDTLGMLVQLGVVPLAATA
jgi:predicted ester cyclase